MPLISLKDPDMDTNIIATVNTANGQLVGLNLGGEYMHTAGRPKDDSLRVATGWSNSELIMFPIVSASKDHQVMYDGKLFPLGQHGIIRAMIPEVTYDRNYPSELTLTYNYAPNTSIDNMVQYQKDEKNPKLMQLPIGFSTQKRHIVNGDTLTTAITITNTADAPFCYALGWHPAFKSHIKSDPSKGIFYNLKGDKILTLEELMNLSKTGAKVLSGECFVRYFNADANKGIDLYSEMGNIMLWSPHESMFCAEPITEKVPKGTLVNLSPGESYKSILQPEESKRYDVTIQPI